MKNSILIICSIIAFLSTACKNEKSSELSGKDIKMVVFEPILEKAGSINTYRISGTIIAPRPVDTKELGFVISSTNLSVPIFQPLGSGSKIGYFETTIQVAGSITRANVEFYLILSTNEYVSSNEIIFTPPTPFNAYATQPIHSVLIPNDVFTCDFYNNDSGNLQLIEHGLQYIATGGSQTLEYPVTMIPDSSPNIPITISIPSSTFSKTQSYNYAIYFKVKNINTNEIQRIVSPSGTFVGS